MGRFKNKLLAKILTKHPSLVDKMVEKASKGENPLDGIDLSEIPWSPVTKPLSKSRVALVTTAGVHLRSQTPYDMEDPSGDPTYRELPVETPTKSYTITHDYYDHADADIDLNVVFPIERLREMAAEGILGGLAPRNFSFMGHIDGPYVKVCVEVTAREVAAHLKEDAVDIALLTPG